LKPPPGSSTASTKDSSSQTCAPTHATPDGDSALIWTDALTALITGWRSTDHQLSSGSATPYD
jgi:hypothetical protein